MIVVMNTHTRSSTDQQLVKEGLVDSQLWERLVAQITKNPEFQQFFGNEDEGIQRDWAERIMRQTIGYLTLSVHKPCEGYGPSPLVDIGWHTLILYTREYAVFCSTLCEREGVEPRFIHHSPNDEVNVDYTNSPTIADTIETMDALGIEVDISLWTTSSVGKCGSSSPECSDNKPIPW